MPRASVAGNMSGTMAVMNGHNGNVPATHFGRMMRKERTAHGWTLREFATRTGINFSHLSRIENGTRPPTEKVALACDVVFPERNSYFIELYQEMRLWAPPGFRDWAEHEERTATLRDWSPTVITGLLQTADYARAVLETAAGATEEIVSARLAARMERQKRVFAREVRAWFIVDEPSLSRLAGSPAVMAAQLGHLGDVARLPNVTMTVMPAVVHPAGASGFVITDTAAYVEHVAGGFVYSEPETVTRLDILFDTLRAESHRVSDSAAIIKRMEATWTTGNPATATPTAGTASKSRRPTE
jgi:plasmid maintenance system antidote protein VapI